MIDVATNEGYARTMGKSKCNKCGLTVQADEVNFGPAPHIWVTTCKDQAAVETGSPSKCEHYKTALTKARARGLG